MESRFTQGKSAVVQYCQSRVYSAGRAGTEREEGGKSTEHTAVHEDTHSLTAGEAQGGHFLCTPQVSVWRALSGEETDKLEQASFPAMVTVHWHKGTTLMRQRQSTVRLW
uniref:Uncharacterized protein n=1 Tax=Dicentrarchus labrax TaxID=13489 RepID=A0A8C4IJZ8_DICLA